MSKCLCCRNDGELDNDGICVTCNLEDYCSGCNQHELDCTCNPIYGFSDNDFGDEDDPHDDLDDWEGDDWDEDDD